MSLSELKLIAIMNIIRNIIFKITVTVGVPFSVVGFMWFFFICGYQLGFKKARKLARWTYDTDRKWGE